MATKCSSNRAVRGTPQTAFPSPYFCPVNWTMKGYIKPMKRLSIMLILALLVSFAMSFTVGAVNINNSVLSSTSSISVSALGFDMDGTPRWGTRIGKLTLSNSNNTSFSGSNYFITLGGLNGGGGISYSLSGYFSDISTAFPSDISAIRSKALSSGYDIEYQFEPTVNTTQLKNVLNQANAKTNTGYTNATWNAFVSAKSTAQTTLDNYTTKTQAQIDTAATNLQNAMNALAVSPNLALLQAQLKQANDITDTGFTPETWQAFTTARTEAQNVINATTKTQTQIDNAYNNLNSAMDGLVLLPNTTTLEDVIKEADAITDIGYTPPTWTTFTGARTTAHDVLISTTKTQSQVNTAAGNLRSAISGLTLLPLPEPPPTTPPPSGFDLGSGNIGGFLEPVRVIFFNYVRAHMPLGITLLAILFGFKVIPIGLTRIVRGLKR